MGSLTSEQVTAVNRIVRRAPATAVNQLIPTTVDELIEAYEHAVEAHRKEIEHRNLLTRRLNAIDEDLNAVGRVLGRMGISGQPLPSIADAEQEIKLLAADHGIV